MVIKIFLQLSGLERFPFLLDFHDIKPDIWPELLWSFSFGDLRQHGRYEIHIPYILNIGALLAKKFLAII